MKRSDLNHLRRLLGWVCCDIGQAPADMQKTMIDVADKLGHPDLDDEAKARLVEGYRQAAAVPQYVRDAVKALEKVVLVATQRDNRRQDIAIDPMAGTLTALEQRGQEKPRAIEQTRINAGSTHGQECWSAPPIVAQVLDQMWEWATAEGRPPKWQDIDDARRAARATLLARRANKSP